MQKKKPKKHDNRSVSNKKTFKLAHGEFLSSIINQEFEIPLINKLETFHFRAFISWKPPTVISFVFFPIIFFDNK